MTEYKDVDDEEFMITDSLTKACGVVDYDKKKFPDMENRSPFAL